MDDGGQRKRSQEAVGAQRPRCPRNTAPELALYATEQSAAALGCCAQELGLVQDDANVYKLIGPVLVKQVGAELGLGAWRRLGLTPPCSGSLTLPTTHLLELLACH